VSDRSNDLDAAKLLELFGELSDRLGAHGQRAQMFVVGGAAMALEYEGGRVTRDVDALFEPAAEFRVIAAEVGESHGLEPDWINDAAKGFMPGPDENPRIVFESDALLIRVPSPEYLLAMKLYAARDERDLADAATLYIAAGYSSTEEGLALLERTYQASQLLPRHQYIVQDVTQRAATQRAASGNSESLSSWVEPV